MNIVLYLLLSNCFNFELLFRFSNIGILSGWNLRIIYAYLRLSSSLYYCIVYYIIISIFPYTLYYTTTQPIFPIHTCFTINQYINQPSTVNYPTPPVSVFTRPFSLIFSYRCIFYHLVPFKWLQLYNLLTVRSQTSPTLPCCHSLFTVHLHYHCQEVIKCFVTFLDFL